MDRPFHRDALRVEHPAGGFKAAFADYPPVTHIAAYTATAPPRFSPRRRSLTISSSRSGAVMNGKHMADAPLVVVACARLDEAVAMIGGYMNSYPVDVGMALANVTVAATSEGLGTSWIFTFNEEKVKSLLNIPADAHVVGLTPLGIPEAFEAPAGRKHLSEILAYNAYD